VMLGETLEMVLAKPLRLEQPMWARLCLIELGQCIVAKVTLARLERFAEKLVLFERFFPDALVEICERLW
jgi:hypothetical protein